MIKRWLELAVKRPLYTAEMLHIMVGLEAFLYSITALIALEGKNNVPMTLHVYQDQNT
jgi:hypothetical protein